MTWNRIALCISDVLGILLVIHLFRLRLHKVYYVFALFIIADLVASSIFAVDVVTRAFDYWKLFITVASVFWVITLWMVYALLEAILIELPGILRFSRYLLNITFVLAVVVAVASALHSFPSAHISMQWSLRSLLVTVFALQRVMATVSIIVLVAILSFVLWFPVQLPRNLVFFSFGFVAYFSAETTVLLIREMVSPSVFEKLSVADLAFLSACFLFLMVKLTRQGDTVRVRIGHRWEKQEQSKLINQLENLNTALLRSARQL